MRAGAAHVVDGDERIVIHLHAVAPAIELGVDVERGTEEQERLIDEMAPEIEEETSGLFRCAALTPVVPRDGAPAIESRLQAKRGAKRILGEELPKREEVAIPPAILKDTEDDVVPLCFGNDVARFRDGRRERLVHDEVLPVRDCLERERSVRAIGRGDHNEIEVVRVLPESRRRLDDARIGVRARGVRLTLGVARDDGRELKPWRRHDQRRVERCAGETVSNETNAKHARNVPSAQGACRPAPAPNEEYSESWTMRRLLWAVIAGVCACSHSARESRGTVVVSPRGDSVLAAAEAALQDGQPWRAARLLAPVLRDSAQRTPERVLLAARAAAGWGGWSEVDRLLTREPWLDTQFSGMGRELLARSATARGEDSLVLRHARLAMEATSNPHERGVRQVLIARAWDRMDSLERAAAEYGAAASLLPDVADWLWLRAAGVTRDSAARATHYAALRTDVAKSRVSRTEAQTRERIGDFSGAALAYATLGARVTSLRLRHVAATAAGDTLARDVVRRELLDVVTKRAGSADARLAVEMLDSSATPLTPAEELVVGRSAAAGGPAARAITAFARAIDSAANATPNDRFTYASLLAGAGRHREAVTQFAMVPASSSIAGRAAYERARATLRTAGGGSARTELEAVVARHGSDTAAASSALFLLGDLATDDGRDDDARRLFRRVAAEYPTSTFAPSARFRAAVLAFIRGDFRAAALELDTLALHRPRSSETLAALYWSGRAWSRSGDSATARTRWEDVSTREPASYYAMLAARRLQRQPWAPAIAADTLLTDSLTIAALRRARLLRDLGMDTEADLEYDWLVEQRDRSAAAAIVAAHAFQQQDLAARAIRLGSRASVEGRAARCASVPRAVPDRVRARAGSRD